MDLLRTPLIPLSWIYGSIVAVRNLFYDMGVLQVRRVEAPVISVGNITAGGTGKTPLVEYVVQRLLDQRLKVAVVSRGYMRRSAGTVVVSDGHTIRSTTPESGDEPMQVARKFSSVVVIVDEQRLRGASHAVRSYGAQVVVMDDGFQHRSVHRDLDIVMVDVARPPHKMRMLPAGLRREAVRSLKRADAVVFSRWSQDTGNHVLDKVRRVTRAVQFRAEFAPKSLVRISDGTQLPPEALRGVGCVVFCGIGNPESFRRLLEDLGADVKSFRVFRDHYWYQGADIEAIVAASKRLDAQFVVTTEKDAVRFPDDAAQHFRAIDSLYYLELETRISGESEFLHLVRSAVKKDANSNH